MKIINNELISFVNLLSDKSGNIIKKYFRQSNFDEKNKEDDSPVTIADMQAELIIRELIKEKFPNHGIIGEEFDSWQENADFKWVIDPIDGTTSFIIGRPIFGTLIALLYKNKPILGVINQPITQERWIGIDNIGSFFNGKKIENLSKVKNLSEAILCATSPYFFSENSNDLKFFESLKNKTKYQNHGGAIYGGDCYLFGLVALKYVDIVLERGLKKCDFMALPPIINNAGGKITDWQGNDINFNSDGRVLACSNADIHQQILNLRQVNS